MSWEALREDIFDMFDRLVVFMPDANTRVIAPELPSDVVARSSRWKRLNAKHVKAYDARRYQANREARLVAAREYYAANRDAIRARRAS